MAQVRGSRRGVTNVVTCAVLLLFGLLGFTAGCSSLDGERLGSQSEAALGCTCPPNNACATFSCSGTLCIASVQLKEGALCSSKIDGFVGYCHLNLCCPGCVIPAGRGAAASCALKEGTADTQCGSSGTTCESCTADVCTAGQCVNKACELKPVPEGGACINTTGGCHDGTCCKGCIDGNGVC